MSRTLFDDADDAKRKRRRRARRWWTIFSVLKKTKTVPNGLTIMEKMVLLAINEHLGENATCWPGVERLAVCTSSTARCITKTIATLKRRKLLGVKRRQSNHYRIKWKAIRALPRIPNRNVVPVRNAPPTQNRNDVPLKQERGSSETGTTFLFKQERGSSELPIELPKNCQRTVAAAQQANSRLGEAATASASNAAATAAVSHKDFLAAWNHMAGETQSSGDRVAAQRAMSERCKANLRERCREPEWLAVCLEAVSRIPKCAYLLGKRWVTPDWFLKDAAFAFKIVNGDYDHVNEEARPGNGSSKAGLVGSASRVRTKGRYGGIGSTVGTA